MDRSFDKRGFLFLVHNRMVSVQEVEARLPRVDPKRSKKDLSAFTNMVSLG